MLLSPDGRFAVVTDTGYRQFLTSVRMSDGSVVSQIDFNGQRTGFPGLYTALTVGAQLRPQKWMTIRPEVRYDYNGYSLPFEGKHGIFTAAFDCIMRW